MAKKRKAAEAAEATIASLFDRQQEAAHKAVAGGAPALSKTQRKAQRKAERKTRRKAAASGGARAQTIAGTQSVQPAPTQKSMRTTSLQHVLLDPPAHPMYSHHVEQAFALSKNNRGLAALQSVMDSLSNQAAAFGLDKDASKRAIDRVKAFWLASQAKALAANISDADGLLAVLGALTSHTEKNACTRADAPRLRTVREKVNEVIKAAGGDLEDVGPVEGHAQVLTKADETIGAANGIGYQRGAELCGEHARSTGQEEQRREYIIDSKDLKRKVENAKNCLEAWWTQDAWRNKDVDTLQKCMRLLFRAPCDLYIAYLMSDLEVDAEDEGEVFDYTAGFVTASAKWDSLGRARQQLWTDRLLKLKKGEMSVLSDFEDDPDVTAHTTVGLSRRRLTEKHAGDFTEQDGISFDGKKIKIEDADGECGIGDKKLENVLSHRPNQKPQIKPFNRATAPRAFGTTSSFYPCTTRLGTFFSNLASQS